jgi:saccharopine dehydrogenase (NADP+, L-glutamate forming)
MLTLSELMATAKPYFIYPGFAFVAYPNRDSTPYKERYNIPEADTIIRGVSAKNLLHLANKR